MINFIPAKLVPNFRRFTLAARRLIDWLIRKTRSIDYTDRKTYIYAGGGLFVLIITMIGYRLLNPTVVLEKGDYGPFASEAEYKEFVAQNPLFTKDEPSGQRFDISSVIRKDAQVVYTIELQSRPIKPEMNDAYIQSYLAVLEDSQKDALDWIRSQGVDPNRLAIIWRPNPQERRARLLGETTKSVPQKNTTPTITPSSTPQPTSAPNTPAAPTPLFPH